MSKVDLILQRGKVAHGLGHGTKEGSAFLAWCPPDLRPAGRMLFADCWAKDLLSDDPISLMESAEVVGRTRGTVLAEYAAAGFLPTLSIDCNYRDPFTGKQRGLDRLIAEPTNDRLARDYFGVLFDEIARHHFGPMILVIMPEFGPWKGYGEVAYRRAWRLIAEVARESLPEALLEIAYHPAGPTNWKPGLFVKSPWLPPLELVDLFGMSWFNSGMFTGYGPKGYQRSRALAWMRYGAEKGKPIAVNEWRGTEGDNATFVAMSHQFLSDYHIDLDIRMVNYIHAAKMGGPPEWQSGLIVGDPKAEAAWLALMREPWMIHAKPVQA